MATSKGIDNRTKGKSNIIVSETQDTPERSKQLVKVLDIGCHSDENDDSSEDLDYTADPFYDEKMDAENAKWYQQNCAAPHIEEVFEDPKMKEEPERRIDKTDGYAYTIEQFKFYYGGTSQWEQAQRYVSHVGLQENLKKNYLSAQNVSIPTLMRGKNNIQRKNNKIQRKKKSVHRRIAITLSCPCCFTELCVECQRHVDYSNQFRAVFARNCKVIMTEKIINKEKSLDDVQSDAVGAAETIIEILHPVICEGCETEVGVYDADGIYHFFEVIAS